jgi:G:T-mismatch repair DNA endonuclease (very short patch repair protein)
VVGNKLSANVARDRDTDRQLTESGWRVVRVWEHQDMEQAAAEIPGIARRSVAAMQVEQAGFESFDRRIV